MAEPQNEPRRIREDQMADVTAGLLLNLAVVIPTNAVFVNAATAAAIGLLASGTTGVADVNTRLAGPQPSRSDVAHRLVSLGCTCT
jgi:hypothetical protein